MKEESQNSSCSSEDGSAVYNPEAHRQEAGLSVIVAAFFIVAQIAGAGFLALPKAIADTGWIGFVLLFLFCVSCGFNADKLGLTWVILEERHEEYKEPHRQPYVEMASRALGTTGRRVSLVAMLVNNIGSTIVFIILISEMIESIFEQFSICEYALMVTAVLIPISWIGTPKEFWQASAFAVFSTVVAVVIIVTEIFLNYEVTPMYPPPEHPNPTFPSFFLGFGAILFAFGGASVFPTIQNDMKDRRQFWKSINISFILAFIMYLPIALFGYIYIGDSVNSNIILSLKPSLALSIAIALQICNLMATFIITMSPVFQSLEELLDIPRHFGLKRVLMRTGIVLFELLVALAFPDFGLIVNLLGGSAMACLCFILPPLIYMKIATDHTDEKLPKRTISTWERIYLWEIVIVGFVGGIAATITSLYALLRPETLDKSCFVVFGPDR